MTYRLSQKAIEDLRGIWCYSEAQWGSAQAESYLRIMEKQFEWIVAQPTLGKLLTAIPGYRQRAAGSHMIIYRIDDQEITVIRVLHQRMDPSRHL